MAKMTTLVNVVDDTLNRLAASYADLPPALRNAESRTLEAALKYADGNPRRLTAEPDGSIIVWNQPVW